MGKKITSIALNEQQVEKLATLNRETGLSQNAIIGELIDNCEVRPVTKYKPVGALNANSRSAQNLAVTGATTKVGFAVESEVKQKRPSNTLAG